MMTAATRSNIERAEAAATPDLVAAYQRDGAVCLRQLLNADELDQLRRGIDANLAAPSPRAIVASQADDPGFFIEDFCNWQENEAYRRFIFETPLAMVAGRLMRSRHARLHHDHMLTKESGTRQRTPWHQDQPYYNLEGRQNCSFWIFCGPISGKRISLSASTITRTKREDSEKQANNSKKIYKRKVSKIKNEV